MAGKSRVTAGEEQRNALLTLAHSRDRGEADRARAILLTLSGWTSPCIAEAFGVREDTVRLWRSEFARGGVEALKATVAPGPQPVKTEAALRVVTPLLEAPVADRPNWTIPRPPSFRARRPASLPRKLAELYNVRALTLAQGRSGSQLCASGVHWWRQWPSDGRGRPPRCGWHWPSRR